MSLGADLCAYGDASDKLVCVQGAAESASDKNKFMTKDHPKLCPTLTDETLKRVCYQAFTTSTNRPTELFYSVDSWPF